MERKIEIRTQLLRQNHTTLQDYVNVLIQLYLYLGNKGNYYLYIISLLAFYWPNTTD
jgi:hypothetical protein